MNSLLLDNEQGLVTDPKIVRHLHETLRSSIGDVLKCAIIGKGLCQARITELTPTYCQLALGTIAQAKPPWFNLVVGISRPQTLKKILEHATTYGAAQIHFFKAALSDKSYLDTKVLEENERLEYLRAGLSQSGIYATLPEIKVDRYNPAAQYAGVPQKYILDLAGSSSFLELGPELDFSSPITLAIGPERGFIREDIDRFHQAGFKSVKISSSTLRVEHAIYSALAQLELLNKQF